MRKDYIASSEPADDETSFVEKHWTAIWEREGGPQGRIDRIPTKEEYRIMAPYLRRLPAGARILDGGCGLGDWTMCLARQGYSVAGLDLSKETIAQLQARFPEAEFMAGDIRHTAFADAEFDAYFSWGVFEHFEAGLQPCISEAVRVLKPGGYLFISVPLDNLRHGVLGSMAGPRPGNAAPRLRFYQWRLTRPELARELAIGGFEVIEICPIHKRQGVLRALHHQLGMSYDWTLTKGLSVMLAPVVPGSVIGHMQFAVARKPLSVDAR